MYPAGILPEEGPGLPHLQLSAHFLRTSCSQNGGPPRTRILPVRAAGRDGVSRILSFVFVRPQLMERIKLTQGL